MLRNPIQNNSEIKILTPNGLFQKFYDWYIENEGELENRSLIEVRRKFVEKEIM